MSEVKMNNIKIYILSQPKLKLRNLTKPTEKNPKSFLKAFFLNYNKKLETVYCSNGQIQCMPGMRRSISDIFLIVYYYFPKASLTKLYNNLLNLVLEDVIVSSICKDINKRVYRGIKTDEKSFINGTLTDEFKVDLKTFKTEEGKRITTLCSHNKHGWGIEYGSQHLKFIETEKHE